MNCMERRDDFKERANWFFNEKISKCPKCGGNIGIEKLEGNAFILEYCGWCSSQWKVTICLSEIKEELEHDENA